MKFFTKISFWNRASEPEPAPKVKPFKTYGQVIQGLPSHVLKKRLSRLNAQLALLDNSNTAISAKDEIDKKMIPIIKELTNRNDM